MSDENPQSKLLFLCRIIMFPVCNDFVSLLAAQEALYLAAKSFIASESWKALKEALITEISRSLREGWVEESSGWGCIDNWLVSAVLAGTAIVTGVYAARAVWDAIRTPSRTIGASSLQTMGTPQRSRDTGTRVRTANHGAAAASSSSGSPASQRGGSPSSRRDACSPPSAPHPEPIAEAQGAWAQGGEQAEDEVGKELTTSEILRLMSSLDVATVDPRTYHSLCSK